MADVIRGSNIRVVVRFRPESDSEHEATKDTKSPKLLIKYDYNGTAFSLEVRILLASFYLIYVSLLNIV